MADTGRPLGPCNLLTLQEAIAELGMRHHDARARILERGLVRLVAGRRRIIAGELVEAIKASPTEGNARPAARRATEGRGLMDLPMARL